MPRFNPPERRFMRRFDYDQSKGWQVIVPAQYAKSRERTSAFFADKKSGGERNAYTLAVKFRNTHVVPKGLKATVITPRSVSRRNASGVIGVSLDFNRYGDAYAWVARWQKMCGHQTSKGFSIEKHGYQGAYDKAVALRAAKTGQELIAGPAPCVRTLIKRQKAIQRSRAKNHPG